MSRMFQETNFNHLDLDLNSWNVGKVTDMSFLLHKARNTGMVHIGAWNTKSLRNMNYMLSESTLQPDLSSWNTSNVLSLYYTFRSNSKFNGDVSRWDTSSVTNMAYLFEYSPFNGDVSKWDISSVHTSTGMFYPHLSSNGPTGETESFCPPGKFAPSISTNVPHLHTCQECPSGKKSISGRLYQSGCTSSPCPAGTFVSGSSCY